MLTQTMAGGSGDESPAKNSASVQTVTLTSTQVIGGGAGDAILPTSQAAGRLPTKAMAPGGSAAQVVKTVVSTVPAPAVNEPLSSAKPTAPAEDAPSDPGVATPASISTVTLTTALAASHSVFGDGLTTIAVSGAPFGQPMLSANTVTI